VDGEGITSPRSSAVIPIPDVAERLRQIGSWRCSRSVQTWSLTTLREKLIKTGTMVVRHAKAVTFQLAEMAVPRAFFAAILARIGRLHAAPGHG